MQTKYIAMAAALVSVQSTLAKTADVYGKLDSQDAGYRSLQLEISAALALPSDPDLTVPPAPVVLAAMTEDQVSGLVNSLLDRLAQNSNGIVTAITAEIEQSDLAVLDAISHIEGQAAPAAQ
jgi:hypothetical protein